nr:G-protein coupled bile acid receptor 1 [Zootoca vivipara]
MSEGTEDRGILTRDTETMAQNLIIWLSRPLSAFIVLANIFLILGILFNRRLRNTTNWFFLSLLFADLLAGLFLPNIPELSTTKELNYHLCFFNYVAPNFIFLAFLANLLVVHYAKYVFIIHSLHYHRSWVYRWPGLYIFVAWTAPLTFACLPLAWNKWQPHANCSFGLVFPIPYLYLETYGFLIPSILAMGFMCIQVLCTSRRQLKDITRLLHSVNQGQPPSELEQQLELRNAKKIASVSFIFMVCWVPYIVCLNISLLSIDHNIHPLIIPIVTSIGTSSAAALPVILSLGNRQYTQFWTDMATKCCGGCCQRQGCKERKAKPKARLPHGRHCPAEADLNGAPG